ncbi:hypothetical protein POM88_019444 [Heracleum sosnowskyi]|uniref:Helitron helicase-like domain-containing protein n=1 Tax=Heracleum sosnowskyi TaxID=360622 RepID=A0AAD8MR52_9APIA|nr:hypothetical protein POM88_019444 [Heracleum sosnowskyi]
MMTGFYSSILVYFLLSQDDGADRAFSSEDMMKGFPRFHTRRKKVSNNKENIDSNKTNTAGRSPLSPFSEIFNTPPEISLTNKVSSVNKFNIHTSSSGLKKTMAAQERIDREPLSNITNENAYSTSRGRKEKGKGKLRHQQSNGTRLEAEFNSTLQQTYDEYFDQLDHSIIADSSLTEDGLDDSNDEFCTEEAWGENVDSDSDVGNATLRAPKVGNQSWRRCDVPHEYATLGPPSVKCTKCHAIMWREERVNKNVTKGTPIFSLCCKKGDVTLPNALPTPPFLLQLYDDELKDGYHNKIPFTSAPPNTLNDRDMISMKDYYSYRFQVRENEGMTARLGGRLFQQYMVDAFSAIEQTRLWWFRKNQTILRNELYHHICDSVQQGDSNTSNVGRGVILPAGYVGSKRYMQQNFQDIMLSQCAAMLDIQIFSSP